MAGSLTEGPRRRDRDAARAAETPRYGKDSTNGELSLMSAMASLSGGVPPPKLLPLSAPFPPQAASGKPLALAPLSGAAGAPPASAREPRERQQHLWRQQPEAALLPATLPPCWPARGTLSPGAAAQGLSTRAPSGCLDPSLPRKAATPFVAQLSPFQRAALARPMASLVPPLALPQEGRPATSPTPGQSRGLAGLTSSLMPMPPASGPADFRRGRPPHAAGGEEAARLAKAPGAVLAAEQPSGAGLVQEPPTHDLDAHMQASLAKQQGLAYAAACAELAQPHAVWAPSLWLEARSQVMDNGKTQGLRNLSKLVQDSTQLALQRGYYKVPHSLPLAVTATGAPVPMGRSAQVVKHVDLATAMSNHPKVHWFGRGSVDIALPEPDASRISPPLIVCARSCVDVAASLKKMSLGERQIFLLTEASLFDEAGAPALARPFATNPHCLPLRSDISRFVEDAQGSLRSAKSTVEKHLTAEQDPYIFLCPDVAVFRGSREDGFPFLEEPFRLHAIVAAMALKRPPLQEVRGRGGSTTWYAFKWDHAALVERLNLVALAALQASGITGKEDEEELAARDNAPILVLSAMGFGGDQWHPRDAFASCLKQWRRRYSQYFHSVYLCCSGRGGGEPQLAVHIDAVVNKSVHRIGETDALASRAMPWHWDPSQLGMSVSGARLEAAAQRCRPTTSRQAHNRRRQEATGPEEHKRLGKIGRFKLKMQKAADAAAFAGYEAEAASSFGTGRAPGSHTGTAAEAGRKGTSKAAAAAPGEGGSGEGGDEQSGEDISEDSFDEAPETSTAVAGAGLMPPPREQEGAAQGGALDMETAQALALRNTSSRKDAMQNMALQRASVPPGAAGRSSVVAQLLLKEQLKQHWAGATAGARAQMPKGSWRSGKAERSAQKAEQNEEESDDGRHRAAPAEAEAQQHQHQQAQPPASAVLSIPIPRSPFPDPHLECVKEASTNEPEGDAEQFASPRACRPRPRPLAGEQPTQMLRQQSSLGEGNSERWSRPALGSRRPSIVPVAPEPGQEDDRTDIEKLVCLDLDAKFKQAAVKRRCSVQAVVGNWDTNVLTQRQDSPKSARFASGDMLETGSMCGGTYRRSPRSKEERLGLETEQEIRHRVRMQLMQKHSPGAVAAAVASVHSAEGHVGDKTLQQRRRMLLVTASEGPQWPSRNSLSAVPQLSVPGSRVNSGLLPSASGSLLLSQPDSPRSMAGASRRSSLSVYAFSEMVSPSGSCRSGVSGIPRRRSLLEIAMQAQVLAEVEASLPHRPESHASSEGLGVLDEAEGPPPSLRRVASGASLQLQRKLPDEEHEEVQLLAAMVAEKLGSARGGQAGSPKHGR